MEAKDRGQATPSFSIMWGYRFACRSVVFALRPLSSYSLATVP